MIVMKFGGTSVGSAREIKRVVDIIKKEPRKKVVVVSAMAGVTDSLIEIAEDIVNSPVSVIESKATEFSENLRKKHLMVAKEVIGKKDIRERVCKEINSLAEKLKTILLGVGYIEELSPKSLDYIMSFGERFSILLVSGALESVGIKSKALTGYEAGIITDSNFGRARPLFSLLEKTIPERLKPLLEKGITPVVAGFIAANKDAVTTTLGRGGSDYTASLIGRYLNVEEVQIWTDVDGILTADPKIVKNARLIPVLSYIEAVDLAYFGAKVIHSKMIEPAMEAEIPVRIKNTFKPDSEGTLIVREQKKIESVIKAVAIQKGVAIINMKCTGMTESPSIASKIFAPLERRNISVPMISGSTESNLSFVVKDEHLNEVLEIINENGEGSIRDIDVVRDVCIITVVGVGMQGTKGIAAKVFQTVAEEDVNIIMIAQGSSEVNISFIVKEEDGEKVVKAIHKRFIESS